MLEQRDTIDAARRLVARGERPVFHVATTWDGSAVDVRIQELPLIHLFVPDTAAVAGGARILISRTLGVDPASFLVAPA